VEAIFLSERLMVLFGLKWAQILASWTQLAYHLLGNGALVQYLAQ
jgi:hypothetical protein